MEWLNKNFTPDKRGLMNFWMDWEERTCPDCGTCFKIHITAVSPHEYFYTGAYPDCSCDHTRTSFQSVVQPLKDAERAQREFERIKESIPDQGQDEVTDDVPF